jgi:hypothetical protein
METTEKPFIAEKEMLMQITGYGLGTINAAFNGTREGTDATRTIRKAWAELQSIRKVTMDTAVQSLRAKYRRKDVPPQAA